MEPNNNLSLSPRLHHGGEGVDGSIEEGGERESDSPTAPSTLTLRMIMQGKVSI